MKTVCVCVCRIRLSEGFHFAASGEGIVNMVIELPMKVREISGSATSRTVQHLLSSWL